MGKCNNAGNDFITQDITCIYYSWWTLKISLFVYTDKWKIKERSIKCLSKVFCQHMLPEHLQLTFELILQVSGTKMIEHHIINNTPINWPFDDCGGECCLKHQSKIGAQLDWDLLTVKTIGYDSQNVHTYQTIFWPIVSCG